MHKFLQILNLVIVPRICSSHRVYEALQKLIVEMSQMKLTPRHTWIVYIVFIFTDYFCHLLGKAHTPYIRLLYTKARHIAQKNGCPFRSQAEHALKNEPRPQTKYTKLKNVGTD
jgi:hypothetical protein